MDALTLQIFVSLSLVALALVLFAFSIKSGDHEHESRLSLLPIEDDQPPRGRRTELAEGHPMDPQEEA